ncbi:MAG TPA: TetR/AcrR family transcriptional regulator [Deinococcales bacterium]|nr:TetR/AcrR family transcriptional regulator [Deinococcales bacterium]
MDNRSLLLDTALRLFAQRGYDAVGVQEIVETAGLTKPTLYHYFGNKLGLLIALLSERHAPLLQDLRAAAEYRGDLRLTLERVLDTYLDYATDNPTFYRFWLSLLFAPPRHESAAVAARLFARQQELLETLFREAARDHGNMRGRHARLAFTLSALVNGVVALAHSGQADLGPGERRELLRQFSHGIYS